MTGNEKTANIKAAAAETKKDLICMLNSYGTLKKDCLAVEAPLLTEGLNSFETDLISFINDLNTFFDSMIAVLNSQNTLK